MIFKTQNSILSVEKLLSLKRPHKPSGAKANTLLQNRWITRVRLKWVKNRGLDHIIDIDTDLKAACLLKDAIKRSSTGFLTANSVSDWHKLLGLTVPVIRFLRRYPTLFHEFPHSRYANLPCFRLTDTALLLDSLEQKIHLTYENDTMERLCSVLMMMRTRTAPLQSLHSLKWDLGLPDNFEKILVPKFSDDFRFSKTSSGVAGLQLSRWREEFAVSELEKSNEKSEMGNEYRQFKSGQTALAFPMNFPRGYGAQKKVRAWMDEFQKLPYISPYDDSRNIDPNSELMEKRAVGILHEFLSLTIHKKTKRNYLRSLREELNLPHKFTRLFTRYPGIFYLSLKCKTTTVTLKEGYQRGKLVNPHPLVNLRKKFYHVMRMGLLYRAKGVNMIPPLNISLDDNIENETEQEETEEEEIETGEECYEETSELEDESDEE
ncbi:protein WHAT'S THIS FACTOR 1 [Citrus clementina]|uniref:protein WHAT'S THIS FACTOR 1 n=1 Tax=Citrus clementina TaxID=85681 RepID=UPI000CED6922|nr:protein WHAT'S THIS FACTOR 1 [Citrus x clementina]XP_024037403.1 protein WHAT'S THIS FACTOR 1 [Citrus x clementina]